MVTTHDVHKIASLARLRLTETEEKDLAHDMNRILGYMDKLNALDTAGVEPLAHVFEMSNVLRPDVQQTRITHEQALLNAPDADDLYFRVPKVIE